MADWEKWAVQIIRSAQECGIPPEFSTALRDYVLAQQVRTVEPDTNRCCGIAGAVMFFGLVAVMGWLAIEELTRLLTWLL